MNKVIDKGFRSCRFVSTIVKLPVQWWRETARGTYNKLCDCHHKSELPRSYHGRWRAFEVVFLLQPWNCLCLCSLRQGRSAGQMRPPQRFQWPAEAFRKNLEIWNFLQHIRVSISAEAELADTCSPFHKKLRPPLNAPFSKWPPSQIICPRLHYVIVNVKSSV